ncbi:unnamed protein product [Arabis nemorensis]|uniref:Uncharacterized protein n=1 Tax=Arabis nemorensis TaxID=586526 RepID=A0A565AUA8_9BRAS|nr:unnamed protein product [Arabis nemorensis]
MTSAKQGSVSSPRLPDLSLEAEMADKFPQLPIPPEPPHVASPVSWPMPSKHGCGLVLLLWTVCSLIGSCYQVSSAPRDSPLSSLVPTFRRCHMEADIISKLSPLVGDRSHPNLRQYHDHPLPRLQPAGIFAYSRCNITSRRTSFHFSSPMSITLRSEISKEWAWPISKGLWRFGPSRRWLLPPPPKLPSPRLTLLLAVAPSFPLLTTPSNWIYPLLSM